MCSTVICGRSSAFRSTRILLHLKLLSSGVSWINWLSTLSNSGSFSVHEERHGSPSRLQTPSSILSPPMTVER